MKKTAVIVSLVVALMISCGGIEPFSLTPLEGLTIRVSGLRYIKSREGMIGMVEVKNEARNFVRISNQELFLYCGADSARAFMKMPGTWQIDRGLINVVSGKTLTYQAFWPFATYSDTCEVRMKYLKQLSRQEP